MKGTLCISSIPNSSSSLCYGKRQGGQEGERMERQVRKAERRKEGCVRKCWERVKHQTQRSREGSVGALLQLKRNKDKWRTHENMEETHGNQWMDSWTLNCPLVPDETRPSHSHPWTLALLCNTAASRSRRCRPLSARCGTAGSGHSGLCSLETLRGTTEPSKARQRRKIIIFVIRVGVHILSVMRNRWAKKEWES